MSDFKSRYDLAWYGKVGALQGAAAIACIELEWHAKNPHVPMDQKTMARLAGALRTCSNAIDTHEGDVEESKRLLRSKFGYSEKEIADIEGE